MWKPSGMQGMAVVLGTMIIDRFDLETIRDELFLSNCVFTFMCIKLDEAPLLEMWSF